MPISAKNRKYFNLLATILLAMFLVSPLSSLLSGSSSGSSSLENPLIVKAVTPCQLQKNARGQASKLCSPSSAQYSITQTFLADFHLPSEKLMFLFILGLLAVSPMKRVYKPPRFH